MNDHHWFNVKLLGDDLVQLDTITAGRVPVRGDHIQFHGEWFAVTGVYLYDDGTVGVTFAPPGFPTNG